MYVRTYVSCLVRQAAVAAGLLIGLCLSIQPAHAIFLDSGTVEADGISSTVDLWFFSFDAPATTTLKVNDLGGPPVVGADPDLVVYLDDGTFSNVFATDTAAGTDPAIAALFPAGAYIAVIANHPLSPGMFGPTHADVALAVGGYTYEFNGPDPVGGNIALNCVLSGNLGGGYTKRLLGQDTCQLPPGATPVPEPFSCALMGLGLAALTFGARRRRIRPVS